MIYATGDTHGNFQRFAPEHFPEQAGMTKEDYMIICGDYIEKNIIENCKCKLDTCTVEIS